MVQVTSMLLLVGALAPYTMAQQQRPGGYKPAPECDQGFFYCGSSLIELGFDYTSRIKGQLKENGLPVDEEHINNSTFECYGGPDAEIFFDEYCSNGCGSNGRYYDEGC